MDLSEQGPRPDPTGSPPPRALGRDEERRLVERSRSGDTEAYGRLVLAHQDRVFGLVSRLVADVHLAEEITQDAFLRAFRALASFRGDARFGTWVYRIAVNLCHDHRGSAAARRRQRETSLNGPAGGFVDPPAPASRPDESFEAGEIAGRFREVLAQLEPIHREAFLLRHQEGLGYDEIAQVLDISVSNAKVRVHRARESILAALRDMGYDV